MFMGPLEATKPWNMNGVEGVYRFLARVWRMIIDDRAEHNTLLEAVKDIPASQETLRMLHHTIKRVTDDLEHYRFNTAISAMMEFTNFLTPVAEKPKSVLKTFVQLLAPFAPHLAEEVWQALGETASLSYQPWPTYNPDLLKLDTVEIPVQVNGKIRTRLSVALGLADEALKELALADPKVQEFIAGKPIKKMIIVPGKLVNIVAG
jgi:leucyl-tRNA synthetase